MPYINPQAKFEIMEGEPSRFAQTSGELNFIFTQIALQYLEEKGEKYQTYNDIIGALEGCKIELYRRRIAPYEDQKIIENGDVYD